MNQKTTLAKAETIKPKWYLIDAKDQILGRLSTQIATILRGKNSINYTPHMDQGNYICIINAEKIKVTGKKLSDKIYYKHSGYIGSLKEQTLTEKLTKSPEQVIYLAVKRMLPKNKLATSQLERLKIYSGDTNPHAGQNPVKLSAVKSSSNKIK